MSACLLLSACHNNEKTDVKKPGNPNMLRAEGFVVKPQLFENTYTASGSLLPNEEIEIHAEVSGRVTNIYFKEGTHVNKGQKLLDLYNADIKAQLQKSYSQKKLQQKIRDRQGELLRIGGISQQDYETTTAQIQSIDADIAYNEAELRRTSIIAPFDGRIGIRDISVGAVISPTTLITTLQQVRMLKMDFSIPDQYRDNVSVGKQVSFSVTGSLDTLTGIIAAIDPSADPTTRNVRVRATIQNEKGLLTPGSFAHVLVPFESDKDALMIPSQAIIPTTRDKKVAVLDHGKAKLVTIKIGARTNDNVQVIQGLQAGDTIITTGIMQVKQGMQVKITKI